ncbi:MAG: hypothetical protein QOJ89_119 [bacterium]|jgi:hypothetical protein
MATHQFKFAVSDVELTPEQIDVIGQAVAQAGALALADITPQHAVSVQVKPGIWWRGIPAPEIYKQLETFAAKQIGR